PGLADTSLSWPRGQAMTHQGTRCDSGRNSEASCSAQAYAEADRFTRINEDKRHMITHQSADRIHQSTTGDRALQTSFFQMLLLVALFTASMATIALVILPFH